MVFPRTANFQSPQDGDAWWTIRHRDANGKYFYSRCETDGRTFAHYIQQMVKSELPRTGLVTFDRTRIYPRDIAIDGKIGPKTMRGIWALLSRDGADPQYLAVIQQAAGAHALPFAAMMAILWLTTRVGYGGEYGQGTSAGPGDIYLSPDVVGLPWSTEPPASPYYDPDLSRFVCMVDTGLGTNATPNLSGASSPGPVIVVPPPELAPEETDTGDSSTGDDTGGGSSGGDTGGGSSGDDTGGGGITPAPPVDVQQKTESRPWVPIAIGVGVLAAGAAAIVAVAKSGKRSSKKSGKKC